MAERTLAFVPCGNYRGIAQLVEQRSPKPRAEGSNPSAPAIFLKVLYAAMAQSVERVLGKDEVTSSNLVSSSNLKRQVCNLKGLRTCLFI